ncbi:MAG: bacteriohemerythrin [Fibrobacterota bacterium]
MSNVAVSWSDSFRVGDVFIDAEHRILFKIAQQVSEQNGRLDAEQVKRYIQLMLEYTQVHFHHEEDLLQQIGWKNLSDHRGRHKNIIHGMKELITAHRDTRVLQKKMLPFVNDWVLDHIIHSDCAFTDLLTEKRGFITL